MNQITIKHKPELIDDIEKEALRVGITHVRENGADEDKIIISADDPMVFYSLGLKTAEILLNHMTQEKK